MATATEAHNKAIVQRWIDEVFNAGSLTAVDELKVSSYLDWTPLPAPYQDVERPVSGIKDALPEWLSGLPDFHFRADHLAAEDEFVVCLGHWRAHHDGRYKDIEATGRELGGTRIDIFRVAGDKMVEHWGCGNELAFLQLVGALESRPTGARAETAEEVGRQFVEQVLGERDVAVLAELLDPHAAAHPTFALEVLALLTAFPDLRMTPIDVTTQGEWVQVTSTFSGTHGGPFLTVPATGRRVEGTRVDRLRIVDGNIVECRAETDQAGLAAQLGIPDATAAPRAASPDATGGAVAQRFLNEVLNRRRFLGARAYCAADAVDHLTGSLTACLTLGGFPDFEVDVEHVVQDGDSTTILATFSGTHTRPVLSVQPTHRGVTGRVAYSFRLGDHGKVRETWTELEPWTLLQQFGRGVGNGRFGPAA
jgi:predicted ester cyclase